MHVLQIGPVPPPEGGVTRNILAIRRVLLERGDRCSVLAISRTSGPAGISDVYHPKGPGDLLRLLMSIRHDILHLHVGGEIPRRLQALIALCGMLGRGKSILTLHSGGYAFANGDKADPSSLLGRAFRSYGKIVCVNESMVRMFNGFGVDPDKVRLISPFAIEIADGDLVIPESIQRFVDSHSPLLLTVGLLEDTYNLESQIDLMDRIIHELPGTGLLIVGSGSLEPELRERIESKPYKDSILLAGDVPHKITLNLIQTCDILLRTTKFDGDAISVREALYFGTPVIATDNRMRPKGVNLISSPLDGEELVEKIIELSSCRDRYNPRSGTDGRENIESVVGLYDELFKS